MDSALLGRSYLPSPVLPSDLFCTPLRLDRRIPFPDAKPLLPTISEFARDCTCSGRAESSGFFIVSKDRKCLSRTQFSINDEVLYRNSTKLRRASGVILVIICSCLLMTRNHVKVVPAMHACQSHEKIGKPF